MKRNLLIAIEGIDGSGKATQAALLAERLGAVVMPFPNYETESGQAILAHLKGVWRGRANLGANPEDALRLLEKESRWDAMALQALFAVNRYEVAGEIRRRVENGPVVLDRYWPSGFVYGSCDGLDEEWLVRIHSSLPRPDAWILLDVPAEESVRRRPERRDRYERDANMEIRRNFYRRMWTDPGLLLATEHTLVAVVDGRGSQQGVLAAIGEALRGHFGRDAVDDLGWGR